MLARQEVIFSAAVAILIVIAGTTARQNGRRTPNSKGIPASHDHRIVGGQETTIEKHPYQVSLNYNFNKTNNSFFCGGFIISENYIMTAAHCFQHVNLSHLVLRAGSAFTTNGTIIPISKITAHPDYNNPAYDKDIAVMKTAEPIKFSDTVQAIALPPKDRVMTAGTEIMVSGWGMTRGDVSTVADHLMDVTTSVVNFTQCRLAWSKVLTSNMFCAGNYNLGGEGSCLGDSGGAAVQDGMAVGIVSFGSLPCELPHKPGVYADIAQLRDWVTEQTGL